MIRAIAFYLPQFHPIPENDAWWGKGFTEWTNVTRARPLFPGHAQPKLPGELGFYDLRIPSVRVQQAELAREYGIHGFCYYYYWFNGKRLLERPLNEMISSGTPDFPFCVCWANENWTRRWDGGSAEVLMKQTHSPENDIAFIRDLLPLFRDPRYIRVDGRPILLVYRTDILPDAKATAARWRKECRDAGIGEIYLIRTESFQVDDFDPKEIGFDAAYEFPPHGTGGAELDKYTLFDRLDEAEAFTGKIYSYESWADAMTSRRPVSYTRFKGVLPAWDNTARTGPRAHMIIGSTPDLYRRWLTRAVDETRRTFKGDEQLVFINAWNEWAEGCYLEPDAEHGRAYLLATRLALGEDSLEAFIAARAQLPAGEWAREAEGWLRRLDRTLTAAMGEVRRLDRAAAHPPPSQLAKRAPAGPSGIARTRGRRASLAPMWHRPTYRPFVDRAYNALDDYPVTRQLMVDLIKKLSRLEP